MAVNKRNNDLQREPWCLGALVVRITAAARALCLWGAVVVVSSVGLTSFADARPDPDLTKSATAFKRVFDPVVANANKSTVEILCDTRRAALGTIVSSDGYILTKASELKGNLAIRTRAGATHNAKLVGVVADDDLALIKADTTNLPAIEWAADTVTKKLEPGDWVAATGVASDRPLAVGIVSVSRRKIPAQAGVLGVALADSVDNKGAKVQQVLPESGAEKAGVKVDDVITAINGKPIRNRAELIDTVRNLRPGDSVKITVNRAGKTMDINATLGATFSGVSPRLDMHTILLGPVSKRASAFPAVIQHDAVLRPTDCGSPLVNLEGKAIGLNIARAGRTETYALPADVVIPLIKDLKAGKYAPATAPATKPDAPTTTPKS